MRVDNSNEFDHAPGDTVDYGFDYSSRLATSETVSSSSWTATTGITLSSPAYASTETSVVASGGTRGELYYLTNTITTSLSRVFHRVIVLSCKRL